MVEVRCGFTNRKNKPIVFLKAAVHTPLNGGWSERTAKSGNARAEQI